MEVREARPDEYEEAGRVTALAYREFAPPGSEEWEDYLKQLADVAGRVDRTVVFVAVEEETVSGCVTLELDHTLGDDDLELAPDTSIIRMLGVDPGARGRGVGRALVQACIDRSRHAGKLVVGLRTTDPMKAAQALYRSMGFERDPRGDRRYPEVDLFAYRLEI
jgi:ribosomal protein S18 acetylase RimI-like enzyme